MRDFIVTVAMTILAASCQVAFGDDTQSIGQTIAQFNECTVGPFGRQVCTPHYDYGSAVCVGATENGRSVWATCWHNVKEVHRRWAPGVKTGLWIKVKDRIHKADIISGMVNRDIALLSIEEQYQPMELDDTAIDGAEIETVGFPGASGQLHRVRQRVVGRLNPADSVSDFLGSLAAPHGQSGGPALRSGRVAGLVWGSDKSRSFYVQAIHIRKCLDHVRVRYRCRSRISQVIPPPVPPPPIIPTIREPPASVPGATGPAGPKGDPGADGSDGRAGERGPAGIQGVPGIPGARGEQGIAGPAGPQGPAGTVTVILVGEDGQEVKRVDNVQSGSVVRLSIKKFLKQE